MSARDGICARCGNESGRPGQGYCRGCHAAYMRAWRAAGMEVLSPEAIMRDIARHYANVYRRRGKLIAQPCEACGAEKVQMHHTDYTKPLQVHWLCRPCHLAVHGRVANDNETDQSLNPCFIETHGS